MNNNKLTLKIDKKLLSQVNTDSGLYITLKKTESCCSVLVEPKVEIIPLGTIENLEYANKVEVYRDYECIVAFDLEIFNIYPKLNSCDISMAGFPFKKPKTDIPVEIVTKEVCK